MKSSKSEVMLQLSSFRAMNQILSKPGLWSVTSHETVSWFFHRCDGWQGQDG